MLSNKELSQKYFEKIGNGLFKCYESGKTRKQTENSGYSNLINHIKQQHPGWEKCNTQASLNFIKCSKKAQNIHGWLDWIVTDGHPFNFVDKDTTRNYSKLNAICTNTLTKYMDLTTKQVEIKIREEMPMKIGLMLDGWCDMSTSTYFLGIFACYATKQGSKFPLIAFSPLLNEEDHTASNQISFIESVLGIYGKTTANVTFLVCDNEETNKSIARRLCLPMIGCASHRLNLALKLVLEDYASEVNTINQLMKKLMTLRNSAKLREKTNLRPIMKCDLRWSSVHSMISRYLELKEFIDQSDAEIVCLLPSPPEHLRIIALMNVLDIFNSVSLKLQNDNSNIGEVRILFDSLIEKFPGYPLMKRYLSLEEGSISINADFEKALAKAVQGKKLNETEFDSIRNLIDEEPVEVFQENVSFADLVLSQSKKRNMVDLSWIPSTSNRVERLFSVVRNIYTDYRKRISPVNLESQMFLKLNRAYWDVFTVESCINKL